jgi:hypothetical protein
VLGTDGRKPQPAKAHIPERRKRDKHMLHMELQQTQFF